MTELVELAYVARSEWDDCAAAAFNVALQKRYLRVQDLTDPRRTQERRFQLRVNGDASEGAVPYAALVAPEQDHSGPYGGMSFVMFPSDQPDYPAMFGMVVGTNGLAPDEAILGRPGHGRKCAAITRWLSRSPVADIAWAKHDPVRIDLDLPSVVRTQLTPWSGACDKYGRLLYTAFVPPVERTPESDALVLDALTALVDLFFDERRIATKKNTVPEAGEIREAWLTTLLPRTTDDGVVELLRRRRFVVVEGPPGTGKTELARRVLRERYAGRGAVIQFHPSTTYESFVGGLSPQEGGAFGFTFRPTPGALIDAVTQARQDPDRRYLLVVDEVNRADLAKVLGEAIFLFEPDQPDRTVRLGYDFPGVGHELAIPANLDVLGTMNSADRSIAILDVAVRRRFAFVPLWPQLEVVERLAGNRLRAAFTELLMIFVEHASDDALPLLPGHSYFIGPDEDAAMLLSTSLRPLLEEYLAQGYCAGFSDELRAYLDWVSLRG